MTTLEIHQAKPLTERKLFLGLWREYLQESHASGSPVLPSEANVAECLKLYDAYVIGSLRGACMVAKVDEQAVGLALFGENFPGGLALETDYGRTMHGWGVYIRPDARAEGVAIALMQASLKVAVELGFQGLVTHVPPDNTGSHGLKDSWFQDFTPGSVEYYIDLREK